MTLFSNTTTINNRLHYSNNSNATTNSTNHNTEVIINDDEHNKNKYSKQKKKKQAIWMKLKIMNKNDSHNNLIIFTSMMVLLFILLCILYRYCSQHLQYKEYLYKLQQYHRAKNIWLQQQQQSQQQEIQSEQLQRIHHEQYNTNRTTTNTDNNISWTFQLQKQFEQLRNQLLVTVPSNNTIRIQIHALLEEWSAQKDSDIRNNIDSITALTYTRPYLLPPNPDHIHVNDNNIRNSRRMNNRNMDDAEMKKYFQVNRQPPRYASRKIIPNKHTMKWEELYEELLSNGTITDDEPVKPKVDYTNDALYIYPPVVHEPPRDGSYPKLQTLHALMKQFPQDDIDYYYNENDTKRIPEALQRFNFLDPREMEAAVKYRTLELPFKVYNVPEVTRATRLWTDQYVGQQFGDKHAQRNNKKKPKSQVSGRYFRRTRSSPKHDTILEDNFHNSSIKESEDNKDDDERSQQQQSRLLLTKGTAQESNNNYFAWFIAQLWDVTSMGLPPVKNNDFTYTQWSKHARYADAVQLSPRKPHFYWQSGVPNDERTHHNNYSNETNDNNEEEEELLSFISHDLPSFSSVHANFFLFEPDKQKGIQCRFGERGVVAATHYDGGRNMVAMITGAKRYILSPPNQCSKLGIFTSKHSPIGRHSLLNFGHIPYVVSTTNSNTTTDKDMEMSPEERAWLQRAATGLAVETILKQGEVLYVPSHWFHYIVSLQKSAQCNVRSGINFDGNVHFGGRNDVEQCIDDNQQQQS